MCCRLVIAGLEVKQAILIWKGHCPAFHKDRDSLTEPPFQPSQLLSGRADIWRMCCRFVITVLELKSTIPTLWDNTQAFMAANPSFVPEDNLMDFVTAESGRDYNLCHFWSNFEIGNLNFLRSKEYRAYFDHLDKANGFFLERWGDAPVHSLAAAMFLNRSQVHHFSDIGYRHNSFTHCPSRMRTNCACDAMQSVQFHAPSFGICHKRWTDFMEAPQPSRRKRQRV